MPRTRWIRPQDRTGGGGDAHSSCFWLIGLIASPHSVLANDKADRVFLNGQRLDGRSRQAPCRGPGRSRSSHPCRGNDEEIRTKGREAHRCRGPARGVRRSWLHRCASASSLRAAFRRTLALQNGWRAIRQGLAVPPRPSESPSVHDGQAERRGSRPSRPPRARRHADAACLRGARDAEDADGRSARRAGRRASGAPNEPGARRRRSGSCRRDGLEDEAAWVFEPYDGGGNGAARLDRSRSSSSRSSPTIAKGGRCRSTPSGDRAIAAALDAYEKARTTNGTRGRRHRIEARRARPSRRPARA